MRRALISDIHGNLEALRAVLDHIRQSGITEVYCLGDIVGYGPNPRECVDHVEKLDVCILGNHDQAAMFDPDGFNPVALQAIFWTRAELEARRGAPAQNTSLVLSGLEPDLLELLDAPTLRSAPVVLWIVIADASGRTMLHSFVDERGRVDRVPVKETSGGTATITLEAEKAARGLGRKTGRLRSDADQRLIKPTDGSFRAIAYAAEKVLYWGGEKPARAGTALNTVRAIKRTVFR